MVSLSPPLCDFGWKAKTFNLLGVDNKLWDLEEAKGENGLLLMFICNHCPYVKAILPRLVNDLKDLKKYGINSIAISSNDVLNYPEDSPELMKENAIEYNFCFPYLYDESQQTALDYDAACTPDFYLYDGNMKLVYRGQLDDSRPGNNLSCDGNDLNHAIDCLMQNKVNDKLQKPSIGCNIKWKLS